MVINQGKYGNNKQTRCNSDKLAFKLADILNIQK